MIWRHRTLEDFRAECPGGDADLQELIVDQLDDRLDWLESLGVPVGRETGTRSRSDAGWPLDLVAALLRASDVLLGEPLEDAVDEPLVLATAGPFLALARRLSLSAREPVERGTAPAARERGATTSAGMDEFYGRALPVTPDELPEETWVRLGQVYGRHALVLDETGAAIDIGHPAWHENDLVEIARRPGGRASLPMRRAQPVRDTAVAERVEAARAAGGTVVDPGELPFSASCRYAVHVTASSRTRSGVSWSTAWHVLGDGTPIDGLYAAGVDAGGIATGGYSADSRRRSSSAPPPPSR